MSYFKNIQIALDSYLDTFVTTVSIAWENTTYTPTVGTPYLRPTLLIGPASLMQLGNDEQMNNGIYQIDAFYPLENGNKDILEMLDALYDHFKLDTTLTSGGTTVYIKEISRISPVEIMEAWCKASIEINFRCYNN